MKLNFIEIKSACYVTDENKKKNLWKKKKKLVRWDFGTKACAC